MDRLRNKITVYSFILTVLVVLLHSGEALLSIVTGQLAVPGFFLTSGFLFMRGLKTSPAPGNVLLSKLGRRVMTLVVPYLIWNVLYFLIYVYLGKASITEFYDAMVSYKYNPVFWYLAQLIVITLTAPLIYLLMKNTWTGIVSLAVVFGLAVMYRYLPFHYCNEDALFYYMTGAFISMNMPKFECHRTDWLEILVSAAFLTVFLVAKYFLPPEIINISEIGYRLSGAVFIYVLVSFIMDRVAFIIPGFMKINFFVYCTHYLIIRMVWLAEEAAGLNGSAAANAAVYLLMPVICILSAWGVSTVMKKIMPGVYSVLTGGR